MLSGGAIAVHTVRPELALSRIGLAGTMLAIIPWLISVSDVRWSEQDEFLIFTQGLWWGLLVVAGICTAAIMERRLNQGNTGSRRWSEIAAGIATVLVFVTSSLEVEKLAADLSTAQSGVRAAVSIWWGLFAIGLLVLGFVRDNALLRYAGLSLLALAAAKAVIYDLASVSALWRAMSFLTLGLLMMGVGGGYARAMSKLKQTDGHDSAPPDEAPSE